MKLFFENKKYSDGKKTHPEKKKKKKNYINISRKYPNQTDGPTAEVRDRDCETAEVKDRDCEMTGVRDRDCASETVRVRVVAEVT